MAIQRDQLERVVVDLLGPYLGESMARASVVGHCRNLLIEGPSIDDPDLETLVDQLRKGMMLFVGPEKAEALAASLRQELGLKVQLGFHETQSPERPGW